MNSLGGGQGRTQMLLSVGVVKWSFEGETLIFDWFYVPCQGVVPINDPPLFVPKPLNLLLMPMPYQWLLIVSYGRLCPRDIVSIERPHPQIKNSKIILCKANPWKSIDNINDEDNHLWKTYHFSKIHTYFVTEIEMTASIERIIHLEIFLEILEVKNWFFFMKRCLSWVECIFFQGFGGLSLEISVEGYHTTRQRHWFWYLSIEKVLRDHHGESRCIVSEVVGGFTHISQIDTGNCGCFGSSKNDFLPGVTVLEILFVFLSIVN